MAETFGKNPEKNLSIGILAHVDAGKTTLSEALLYSSGSIKKIGPIRLSTMQVPSLKS